MVTACSTCWGMFNLIACTTGLELCDHLCMTVYEIPYYKYLLGFPWNHNDIWLKSWDFMKPYEVLWDWEGILVGSGVGDSTVPEIAGFSMISCMFSCCTMYLTFIEHEQELTLWSLVNPFNFLSLCNWYNDS